MSVYDYGYGFDFRSEKELKPEEYYPIFKKRVLKSDPDGYGIYEEYLSFLKDGGLADDAEGFKEFSDGYVDEYGFEGFLPLIADVINSRIGAIFNEKVRTDGEFLYFPARLDSKGRNLKEDEADIIFQRHLGDGFKQGSYLFITD